MSKKIALCLLGLILFGLVACGGGGGSTPTPTPTPIPTPTPTPVPAALTVTPSAATLALNGSQQFTASGAAAPVTWTLTGIGSLSATGFYIAPAGFTTPGTVTVTVTATSIADSTKTATSSVSVVYPNKNNATESTLPIKLGSVGENLNDTAPGGCCVGTLGSLIARGASNFILSNNHVLARSGVGVNGEAINQTRSCGGGTNVGVLAGQSIIKPTSNDASGCAQPTTATLCGVAPDNVDAAISTANANVDTVGTILELGAATNTDIGDLPPSSTIGTASVGLSVAKSGRTTGLTCSTIEALNGTVAIDYDSSCGGATAFQAHFSNQIMINGGSFIESGDSGSLLVDATNAQPLGLLYAANTVNAVANPIGDVLAVMNTRTSAGLGLVAGNPNHPVSCQSTQVIPNSKQIGAAQTQVAAAANNLSVQQKQTASTARNAHVSYIMSDQAVRSVTVGASADNPGEAAVVIELSAAPRQPIPPVLDGVRTRVIFTPGATVDNALSAQVLQGAITVKEAHVNEYFGKQGIRAVAVGRSSDNPLEPAIFIYTTTGVKTSIIPAVIDGVRTRVIEGTPFRAQ